MELNNTTLNYQCPDCNGRFNYPVASDSIGTNAIARKYCPFCGREMVGLGGYLK